MQKIIAQITDTHIDDPIMSERGANARANLEAVLQDISKRDVDELVFTGDIGETAFEWFFERLGNFKPGFKILLGNHDNFAEAVKYYKNSAYAGTNELYYSIDSDNTRYIYLDSSAAKISQRQLEWLSNKLKTDKRIIVFIHHPILAVNTGIDAIYPLRDRDRINELLQQCTQEVTVFCGHYHMPDKRTDRNVTQYVTPAVSFQLKKESKGIDITTDSFGYRLINITSTGVETRLILNRNGSFTAEEDAAG